MEIKGDAWKPQKVCTRRVPLSETWGEINELFSLAETLYI